MDDSLLSVRNVSVKYCRSLHRSLRYGLADVLSEFFPIASNRGITLRKDEFWAIRDISFDLRRGECLGLIGPNGSGKSTLLKTISGILKPDEGSVTVRGKIGALVELGTGFRPILTGRENIYINGAILGLSRRDIDRKFDQIVQFAEIGDFIDTPIQSYSTGMALRLAFAVAVHLDVDILLLDEVFAVGDIRFRSKCIHEMQRLLSRSAVIFVSHSMQQIARLSTTLMVLNQGRAVYSGADVRKGIDYYYAFYSQSQTSLTESDNTSVQGLFLSSAAATIGPGNVLNVCHGQPLEIGLSIVSRKSDNVFLDILFQDDEASWVAEYHSSALPNGSNKITEYHVILPDVPLNPGRYLISLVLRSVDTHKILAMHNGALELNVVGDYSGFAPVQVRGNLEKILRQP